MKTLLLIIAILFLVPCYAIAQEALFTTEVSVDRLEKTSEKSREEALIEAERKGLSALLEKFAPDLKDGLLESLDAKAISSILKSKEIISESVNGKRYRADLRLNFSAIAINQLIENRLQKLQSDEILRQPSTIILPVFEVDKKFLLFENKNVWRKAWIDSGVSHRGGTLILPYGDMVDINTLNAEKTVKNSYKDFMPTLRRYGVRDVMVVMAELAGAEKKRELRVILRRVQASKDDITSYVFPADPGVDDITLMQQASVEIATKIEEDQLATLSTIDDRKKNNGIQKLVIGVKSLKNYVALKKKIEKLPQVEKLEVLALSATQADLRIYYKNTSDQLQESMKNLKIRLTIMPDYWAVEEGI